MYDVRRPLGPGPRQTIDPVERGNFVTFRQSGIVEDGVDEIVDLPLIGHDGLTYVNKLRRAFSNGMNTQECMGVAME